ncbi:hypothetical protein [Geoalkalibacter halelectricus]|uniref:Uncharacterized protein n=1 Tax=Geoalkalibacter halelectricus TaxID=2847045 RepID=A0ABY5ZNP7_9BACT|nr:hypothetical protein [Geoalkalibacter halelectricus]MDO3377554.1 hypothetical protein [Geoalkalibacter halelectricus]UWZ80688.1 hypothetical protein L9S41_04625 [Geoalkalibacter halelectricus]
MTRALLIRPEAEADIGEASRHQLWAWTAESKETITRSLTDPRPSARVETAEEAEKTAKRWSGDD